jgi:hypothetical protein
VSKPQLQQAVRVLIAVEDDGCDLNLDDWQLAAHREFRAAHPDADWNIKNPIGAVNRLARRLSELTQASLDDCKAAVVRELELDKTSFLVQSLLDFGRTQLRRRSA